MEKSYEIKLYTQKWAFKKPINLKDNTNEINFSEEINGWQGGLTLQIIWNQNEFMCSDIIEIREVSKINKSVISTYTWVIENISIQEYKIWTILNIELYWIFTVLNDIIYKDGINKNFIKNDTPGNIIKNIIDNFNSQYWNLEWETQNLWSNIITYNNDSIDISWTSISIEFDWDNCLDAIKKVVENTNYYFYIDEKWIFTLKLKNNWDHRYLTFDKEIIFINKKIKKNEMVNKYYLIRSWDIEKTYSSVWSISSFNLKEKIEKRSEIQNEVTQDEKWNWYINKYSVEIFEISLIIKSQPNNFMSPWMLVTTQNTKNQLFNQQITKIEKKIDNWVLYLWEYSNIWDSILSIIK